MTYGEHVCLFVCLSVSISLEIRVRSSSNFLCLLPMAVARLSSFGIAICCIYPVSVCIAAGCLMHLRCCSRINKWQQCVQFGDCRPECQGCWEQLRTAAPCCSIITGGFSRGLVIGRVCLFSLDFFSQLTFDLHFCMCIGYTMVWLGSWVVSLLGSGAEGPGFKSQPWCCRVTVLHKLFTPFMPLFTKQQNW